MAIKPKKFVITALQQTENNGMLETVYYAEDSFVSDGNPFWTRHFSQARMFNYAYVKVDDLLDDCNYMYVKITAIKVFEIILEAV